MQRPSVKLPAFHSPHWVHITQGANMLIPIHAYPMMNQTKFPRRISFGKCAVGETYAKHVSLTCNVPIDFEYEISMLQPNAAFVVQPHKGVVPANGMVDVEVIFCPTRLVTEMAELEVNTLSPLLSEGHLF